MAQFYPCAQHFLVFFYFWKILPSAKQITLLHHTELWNSKDQEMACVLHLFIVHAEIFSLKNKSNF